MIAVPSRPIARRRYVACLALLLLLGIACAGFEGVDLGQVFPAGSSAALDETTVAIGSASRSGRVGGGMS